MRSTKRERPRSRARRKPAIASAALAELSRKPGWRDDCIKLLRDFISNERGIAKSSYSEFDGIGRPPRFDDAIWERADPHAYALVKRARGLIQRARTLSIHVVRR